MVGAVEPLYTAPDPAPDPLLLKVIEFVTDPAVVAVVADVAVAALPLTLIAQVPDAPEPELDGTSRAVRAPAAVFDPVPPEATGRAVPSVSDVKCVTASTTFVPLL